MPAGAIELLCGLKGLESFCLLSRLSQGQAQLLAGMPCLKEVTVYDIDLTTALDMQRCSWHTLELLSVPKLQSIPFLPQLSGGLRLPAGQVFFDWTLGTALGSEAVTLATKSTVISDFLVARSANRHGTSVFLSWEKELPDAGSAESTIAVLSALAPWDIHIKCLKLKGCRVDASVIQAINTHLPSCRTLCFLECDVTSQAWAEMRWLLPSCTELDFDLTPVTIADLSAFVYTVQRGVSIYFDISEEDETVGIHDIRNAIPAMLPELEAYRSRAGIPPCTILLEMLD